MNYGTKEPEYPGEASLQLRYKLPCCGVVLVQTCVRENPPHDPLTRPELDTDWARDQGEILDSWRLDRESKHVCALVSPGNPFGQR